MMNEFIDDGPILYQYAIENDYKTNAYEYMELFNNNVTSVVASVLLDFIQGKIVPIKQDKSKASWVGKRTGKDCQIDFTKKIDYQKAFFRALVMPYPLPYFEYKGEKMLVTDVDFQPSTVKTHIGRILNIDNEGLWVKVLDGYMIIKEIVNSCGDIISFSKFRIGQYLNKL
jgi:methionyl-tRNA formyltransferase